MRSACRVRPGLAWRQSPTRRRSRAVLYRMQDSGRFATAPEAEFSMSIVQRSIECRASSREDWLLPDDAGFASCCDVTRGSSYMDARLDETPEETPRRGRLGQKIARVAATCAMGSWVVIGGVPVGVAVGCPSRYRLASFSAASTRELFMTERAADYPIDRLFIDRWSPRAFTGEAISETELFSLFEAARWAPSSYNSQPWRFFYARRDTAHWDRFLDLLIPYNRSWAQHAAALIFVVSKSTMLPPGKTTEIPSHSHSFDAGAAWGSLALQA